MQNSEKILLVDDEQAILDLLKITLQKEHFNNLTCALNGKQTLQYVKSHNYDLILLDVMLPDLNGFDLCNEIRKYTNTPIIFITSCASDLDKLTGLTIGGDDYITKPFNPLEVAARIKVLFRRQSLFQSQVTDRKEEKQFNYGRFIFKPQDAELIVKGNVIECTATEINLLRFFCRNPNRIYTTSQIFEYVWGSPGYGEEKTVTMYISKLRKKLEDDTRSPSIIVNLRGIGYKFVPPVSGGSYEN